MSSISKTFHFSSSSSSSSSSSYSSSFDTYVSSPFYYHSVVSPSSSNFSFSFLPMPLSLPLSLPLLQVHLCHFSDYAILLLSISFVPSSYTILLPLSSSSTTSLPSAPIPCLHQFHLHCHGSFILFSSPRAVFYLHFSLLPSFITVLPFLFCFPFPSLFLPIRTTFLLLQSSFPLLLLVLLLSFSTSAPIPLSFFFIYHLLSLPTFLLHSSPSPPPLLVLSLSFFSSSPLPRLSPLLPIFFPPQLLSLRHFYPLSSACTSLLLPLFFFIPSHPLLAILLSLLYPSPTGILLLSLPPPAPPLTHLPLLLPFLPCPSPLFANSFPYSSPSFTPFPPLSFSSPPHLFPLPSASNHLRFSPSFPLFMHFLRLPACPRATSALCFLFFERAQARLDELVCLLFLSPSTRLFVRPFVR